jgi:hypothetical protein
VTLSRLSRLLGRGLGVALAAGSAAIVVCFGLAEVRATGIVNVAAILADGDKVRPAVMKQSVATALATPVTGLCFPHLTRAASVVLFAEAQARIERGEFDEAVPIRRAFGDLNERTLACAPGSGFDWVLRYWYEAAVRLDQQAAFRAAEMSYRTAPNEGWIIVRRLPYMLASYEIASPGLQHSMLGDFRRLALAQSTASVVDIYIRSNEKLQALFRTEMASIPYEERVELVEKLRKAGLEIDVRGVPPPASRAWRQR